MSGLERPLLGYVYVQRAYWEAWLRRYGTLEPPRGRRCERVGPTRGLESPAEPERVLVEAALSEAERALAERDRFVLGEADWLAFIEALDRPVHENPGLARLFAKPSVF